MDSPEIALWTAWCHYAATGEGVTLLARIGYATNAAHCRAQFAEAFDPFWAAFAVFEPGIARNPVTECLFSPEALRLVDELNGRGSIEIEAKIHYNLA